ncbi:hypothetical protein B0A75_04685 [Flavobacterium oncorhynchi]|uniref:Prohead serine protease domain-containing protein n=2 Tax=Flavobacterium oncorhynchi TaxID=728056 RepID=A0A226I768_9FLAO|nr:hypothetical protein B0A75_04685 [Flavobacterium oncorhynchi]
MESKIIKRDVQVVLRELTPEMIENREAEFVISSEAKDTYDTVFTADGAEFERYESNPIVAYGHRTWSDNPDMIIGTSEVSQEGKLTIGKVRFEDAESNPIAEKVWKKVQAGILRMASIGANILEWRMGDEAKGEDKSVVYFTRWELLEWSIVAIGSNPDALKREAQTAEEIRNSIKENTPENENLSGQTVKRTVREAQLIINENLK